MSRGLPKKVSNLLEKAKESALLAVDIYNKPKTSFRSSGFIVLMCIAWTSLLHAIFERKKIKYFDKKSSNRYIKIDGEKKAWSLAESVKYFFDKKNPVLENILFFCKLRNKIEHRFFPEIDAHILSECQSFILGFENILTKEFGNKHTLLDDYIPLQLSKSMRKIPETSDGKSLLSFIEKYRNSLSTDITSSQDFAYKIFIMPNVGNHRNSSDTAIDFIKIDENNPEEMEKYGKSIVAIKQQKIQVANQGYLKPSRVIEEIEKKTRVKKTRYWHTTMWKKHKVRSKGENAKTIVEYCQYDEPHRDYIYTDKWVDFLIKTEINPSPPNNTPKTPAP